MLRARFSHPLFLKVALAAYLLGPPGPASCATTPNAQAASDAAKAPNDDAQAPNASPAAGRTDASTKARAAIRKPDVPYEPSPTEVVTEMLRLADVTAKDKVIDLGCGDGRIVIAAVKERGATGVCVDIDPERIRESRANAERAGVADRITFLTQDLFETKLGDASVVMLFLWPEINLRLRPKLLRELAPGARIVSHWHDMGDWKPDQTAVVNAAPEPRPVFLWKVSAAARASFTPPE